MENVIKTYIKNRQTAKEFLLTHSKGKKVCYSQDDIHLIQTGKNEFTVIYFLQVKTELNYTDAATELGCCIMHQSACNGILQNG